MRALSFRWSTMRASRRRSLDGASRRQRPQDQQEHDGAHECDHDAPEIETCYAVVAEEREQPTAEKRSDDSDDDVSDQSARTFARNDRLCEKARDETYDDPR